MSEWMNKEMNETSERMNEWTNVQMSVWINERSHEWMIDWMITCSSCFLSKNPSATTGGRFCTVFKFFVCLLKLCLLLLVVKLGVLLCFVVSLNKNN